MARPKASVDTDLIVSLAEIDCTYEEIASITGVSTKTLQRRFVHLIENGRNRTNASLRRRQYELALAGNTKMLIWLGKQRLGQRDRLETETAHSGSIEVKAVDYRIAAAPLTTGSVEDSETPGEG